MSDKQVNNDKFKDYVLNLYKDDSFFAIQQKYTEDEILSIIDEHASDIILNEDENISIMAGLANRERKDY